MKNWFGKDWPIVCEGMEFAIFAAGIDFIWQIGEELLVEISAGKFTIECLSIDAGDYGFKTRIDEIVGKFSCVFFPEREDCL